MTNIEFNQIVSDQLEYCCSLLCKKGAEYDLDTNDRFHSFKVAGSLEGKTPTQALAGMMAKHTIYANQLEGVAQQIKQYTELKGIIQERPKFIFAADAPKDFWDITLDDIDVIDYYPMPAIKYEVVV